jgi:hypothetical protein
VREPIDTAHATRSPASTLPGFADKLVVEETTDGSIREHIPGVTDDPVLGLILSGRAGDLDEAEELYLDESLPDIVRLVGSALTNADLERHPLLTLLRSRGMRGREDSLL